MQSAKSLGKILMLGKIEGGRRRGKNRIRDWMASPLNEPEFEQTPGDSEGQGSLVNGVRKSWILLSH